MSCSETLELESFKSAFSNMQKKLRELKRDLKRRKSLLEDEFYFYEDLLVGCKEGDPPTEAFKVKFDEFGKQLVGFNNKSSAASTSTSTSTKEKNLSDVPADTQASIRNSMFIDDSIIIDFAENVLPTKSGLELSIRKSSDNSLVETIDFNSSTPDGLVSFETRIEDYSHNTVALGLNDFTDELASEYGVKAGSQTGDYWASKLQDEWLLVIDDQSYEAKAKSDWTTDTTWSYHELTPEYTPGQDLSGTKQILLSPKDGIKQLTISPKTSLSYDTDYYLEIDKSDFKVKSTGKDLAAYKLDFDLGSSSKSNAGTKNTESGSTQDQKQRLVFDLPSKFNNKIADKLTNFNPSKETLGFDSDSFGIGNSFTFKSGRNSKSVRKLANKDFYFLYDEKKGGLYFNENGADKGFGDGGIIAILKGAADFTSRNLEFV